MNLKEQRKAKMAEALKFKARIKAGDALSDDEVKALTALLGDIESLDAQIAKADENAKVLASVAQLPDADAEKPTGTNGGEKASSLGAHFVKELKASGHSLKDPGSFVATEFKAATDTQSVGSAFGPLVTDIDRTPVLPFQRPLVVADLMAQGSVSGNAITYPVFGALEGTTAFIAEGAAKPQLHVADPDWKTDALGEIAGWFKVTDDMAEDVPYIVSEIQSTAIYDLSLREELALLSGDGSASSITGILNRSGVQTIAKGTDSDPDRIFSAISKVQEVTGFVADGIVINPADYQSIRLSKDANGQYFGGGFFSGAYGTGGIAQNPPLWGLKTVVTSSITQGTVVVGAFKAAAKVFRKGGLRVESTNSHADDFTNDKITIRIRERLGLQVKFPAAFVKVALGTAAGA